MRLKLLTKEERKANKEKFKANEQFGKLLVRLNSKTGSGTSRGGNSGTARTMAGQYPTPAYKLSIFGDKSLEEAMALESRISLLWLIDR